MRIQQLHLGSLVRRERPDAAVDAVRAAYASLCLPGDCYVPPCTPWPRGCRPL
ncbi:MAG: hypothetical protein ACLRRT_10260 [Ruthenibacterium lactatiformans]